MPRSNAVVDNFNRANSTVGANWTTEPLNDGAADLLIVDNVLRRTGYGAAWRNTGTVNDQTDGGAENAITLTTGRTGTADGYGVWLSFVQDPNAASSTADGYELGIAFGASGNPLATIYKLTNGVYNPATALASNQTLAWQAGDLVIARRSPAGLLQLIRDRAGTETVAVSVTDTTYTGAFYAAVAMFDNSTMQLDDFSFGNVPAAGTTYTKTGLAIVGP